MHNDTEYREVWNRAFEIARNANICDVMDNLGFAYKREGNSYRSRDYSSLTFNFSYTQRKWLWFRHSMGVGGDAIALCKHLAGMEVNEAVDFLSGGLISQYKESHGNSSYSEKPKKKFIQKAKPAEPEPEPLKEFVPPAESRDVSKAYWYLTQIRGIEPKLVKYFIQRGFICQEAKNNNIIFKIFDNAFSDNKKYIGAEKVGTYLNEEGKVWKGIHSNSNCKEYGFEIKRGSGEKICFFESSIDLLSFLELTYKVPLYQDFRLVSMTGVKPAIVHAMIKRYGIAEENVYIASDNDKAGNHLANEIHREMPSAHRLMPPISVCKDWNDYLRVDKGMLSVEELERKAKEKAEKAAEVSALSR